MYVLCIDRSLLAGGGEGAGEGGGGGEWFGYACFVRQTEGKGWDLMQRGGGGKEDLDPPRLGLLI